MNGLSGLYSQQQPRSAIIVAIQRESKQLRKLENENRELRCALEDHQMVLELIMSKYRHQASQLIKMDHTELGCLHIDRDNSRDIITRMTNQICEMAAVMNKAIDIDETMSQKDKEKLAQLTIENQGLRELLKIAQSNGSLVNYFNSDTIKMVKNNENNDKNDKQNDDTNNT